MEQTEVEQIVQVARRQFFAYRNGIYAEALRAHGDPHRFIMGCLLTDLMTIASTMPHQVAVAQALWDDAEHRECQLVATMVYPPALLDLPTARRWCSEVRTEEVADVLCHSLLRRADIATELAHCLCIEATDEMSRYVALRLALNLLMTGKLSPEDAIVRSLVDKCRDMTGRPAHRQLLASLDEELNIEETK